MNRILIILTAVIMGGGGLFASVSAQPIAGAPAPSVPSAVEEPLDDSMNRLLEIQQSLNELGQRRAELIEELNTLKNDAPDSDRRGYVKRERLIRERTGDLHQLIEKRQSLMAQKARLYLKNSNQDEPFRRLIAEEMKRAASEADNMANQTDRIRSAQERLRLIQIIQEDLNYLKDNPDYLDRLRELAGDETMIGNDERPQFRRGPALAGWQSRMDSRPRGPGARDAIPPPPQPEAMAQRLERLERELNFMRNQSERIEREINFLKAWVESQVQTQPPLEPNPENKESVE